MPEIAEASVVNRVSQVKDQAKVLGRSRIGPNVELSGFAVVQDSIVTGRVKIGGSASIGHATIAASDAILSTIQGNAVISGKLCLDGRFHIRTGAEILDQRHYLSLGPVGKENRFVTLYRTVGGGHRVMVGCWRNSKGGTLDQLESRIQQVYGTNRFGAEYLAFIEIARLRAAEWRNEQ